MTTRALEGLGSFLPLQGRTRRQPVFPVVAQYSP
jgi:hypothetical protein